MNRRTICGLSLALTLPLGLSLSCTRDNIDGDSCAPGSSQSCDNPTQPPGTMGPDKTDTVGQGGSPFDPNEAGSGGIKRDDKGNVVLDPGTAMGGNKPILWVANSAEGTVSKVDTRAMQEVARYYTHPGGGADPSRTTVGLSGDVVVANRAVPDPKRASAVKIAGDKSGCVDRNRNGKIDTFEGAGAVPAQFVWQEGQAESPDECVLWLTDLSSGGVGTLPRAAGFNAEPGNEGELSTQIYIGLFGTHELLRLDAKTGAVLKRIAVSPAMPYGLVIDKDANVWIRGAEGSLVKVDVRRGDAVSFYDARNGKAPPCPYGITADARGNIYTAGSTCVSRFNPMTETWDVVQVPGSSFLRGLGADGNFGIWATDTSNGMFHIDASGANMVYKGMAAIPGSNVGAAIDFDGIPWLISLGEGRAYRVDPKDYSIRSVKVGNGPYTYSDMTGSQLRIAANPFGQYRHVFPGCGSDTRWLTLNWKLSSPSGTSIVIKARAGATRADLESAAWTLQATVPPDRAPVPLRLPAGSKPDFLQVEFTLHSTDIKLTPILTSVSVGYDCNMTPG